MARSMVSVVIAMALTGGLMSSPAEAITETRLLDQPTHQITSPAETKTTSAKGKKRKAAVAEIPPAYWTVSEAKRVPADLLYAISLQESKLATNKGRIVPWPWTVNWRGKGYRFKTRAAMYQFCQKLLKSGYRSFDVGIAQVNWRWHSERFDGDLWAATDPWTNLNAAAKYLRERYEVTGDWWLAAGQYHNPNNEYLARTYRNSVRRQWQTIKVLLAANR